MALRRLSSLVLVFALLVAGGAGIAPDLASAAGTGGERSQAPSILLSGGFDSGHDLGPGAGAVRPVVAEGNRGPTGRLGPRTGPSRVAILRANPAGCLAPVLVRVADLRHRAFSTRLALARSGLLSRRSTAPPPFPAA